MKKIVLFFVLLLVCSISYGQDKFSNISMNSTIYQQNGALQNGGNQNMRANQAPPQVILDRVQFEYSLGDLVLENFTGNNNSGDGDINCGLTINSSGDNCFPAGEIEENFSITASNGDSLTLYETGFYQNQTVNLVGASTNSEFTIITFTKPVFEIGFEIYSNVSDLIEIRSYDLNGNLLFTPSVFIPLNTESFFGVNFSEPVGHIEIEGLDDGDELLGALLFTAQPGAGDGSSACNEDNNSNNFQNGLSYNFGDLGVVNDVTLAPNENFNLQQITYNSFHVSGETITSVDVNYYAWAGGLPGELIGSEQGVVPTSQTLVGNSAGFDVSEVVLDVTPMLFESQIDVTTIYWIELVNGVSSGGGPLFWEVSSNIVNGNPAVVHDTYVEGFFYENPAFDGVYSWGGECQSLGTIDNDIIETISYYPNPSTNVINITSVEKIENVEFYNMGGKKIMDQEVNNVNSLEINVSNLAVGLYLMKVFINGQIGVFKIIKQ